MALRWISLTTVAAFALLLLAGCGGDKKASLDPPEVKYGQDISEMGMFVSDPRFTVAYLPEEGKWILFDDIGEMFKYQVTLHPDQKPRVIWVNDYRDKTWLKVEDAWFVQSPSINSPMGWGIAAFRDENAARSMQQDTGGTLMRWDDVKKLSWDAPPAPMMHDHQTPPATPSS